MLGFKAVALLVKCDLSEHSHSMGLPGLADAVSPCPFCFGGQDTLYTVAGLSPVEGPRRQKRQEHYEHNRAACESVVVVETKEQQALLKASLVYQKSRGSAQGRGLAQDLPSMGLLKKDRLEPSLSMPDVAAIDSAPLPVTLTFWRTSVQTGSRHRNPLFSEATRVSPQSLGIDWLHTLSLGVFPHFLGYLVWAMFDKNVFGTPGPFSSVFELSVSRIRAELFEWYRREQAANRARTRVQ